MTPGAGIVVVGGSLAGLAAARRLREEGYEGRLRIVGDEPRLPYERPPLSKELLAGRVEPDALDLPGIADVDAEWLLGRRAVRLARAAPELDLADGAVLRFDGLVIATGSEPNRLAHAPAAAVLRTLDDALALRAALEHARRLVVVGAGFVGCEVAATAAGLGIEATVVELGPAPLAAALGKRVGNAVAHALTRQGVRLACSARVADVRDHGGAGASIRLDDGRRLDADVLLVAVGARPATGWLSGSRVRVADGVLCDERCRTGVPGVVAAGDVVRWRDIATGRLVRVEHWEHAEHQGATAAQALLHGAAAPPFAVPPFVTSEQGDSLIQVGGWPEGRFEPVEGDGDGGPFAGAYADGAVMRGAVALDSPRAFRRLWKALPPATCDKETV